MSTQPRILVARAVFPETLQRLAQHFDVESNPADEVWSKPELIARLQDKEGAFTTGTERIDEEVLAACPRLRICANMAVGFNNFDVPAMTARRVLATNTPDVLTETTADFGFALVMATARRIAESEHYLRAGKWTQWSYDMFAGAEVHGSTLGILGMGRIGQGIARRGAHGFGMQVIYHNRSRLAPELLGPIAVAAYSYMSLVPIIQPPIMKALTTKKERQIRMEYAQHQISDRVMIVFPIVVTVLVALIAPDAAPLIASLMLGNLLREAGVVDRLSKSAQNELLNIATLFLGLTVGATMTGESFIRLDTLLILVLGLFAFSLDSVGGLLFGKLLAFFSKGKINPLVGACGISAFPMSGRLSAQVALEEDPDNFILMHAMGSNTAGQLASVVAGSVLFALVVGLV